MAVLTTFVCTQGDFSSTDESLAETHLASNPTHDIVYMAAGDASVTGASNFVANAAAPGGQDTGEITFSYLDSLIGSVASGTTITSSSFSWTNSFAGSSYSGWDSVNKRVYAVAGGRFRLTWHVYQDADSTSTNVRMQHGITVRQSGVDIAHGQATSTIDGSSNEVTDVFTGSKVIDMATNDYITITVSANGGAGVDIDVAPAATASGTWVQLEYLGPAV